MAGGSQGGAFYAEISRAFSEGSIHSRRARQTAPHEWRLLPLLVGTLNGHYRKVVQQGLAGTEGIQVIQASPD